MPQRVWVVFNGHRVMSVWTTEAAARQAREPGQYVEESALMPTVAAWSGMSAFPDIAGCVGVR